MRAWAMVLLALGIAPVTPGHFTERGDSGYVAGYSATVALPEGGRLVCDLVAIWESRREVEVGDCQ